MQTFITVHAVAQFQGKILVMQRAAKRHDHPNIWNVVTGYIQERESAEDAALRELKEETNLDAKLIKSVEPYSAIDGDKRWVICPVLLQVTDIGNLRMDEAEAQHYQWIDLDHPLVTEFPWIKRSLSELELLPH